MAELKSLTLDTLWHARGSVPLSTRTSDDAVLNSVVAALQQQRKPIINRVGGHVRFEAPLGSNLAGPNWLALIAFDEGRIWIEKADTGKILRYDLRSLHAFALCLFAGGFVFSICALGLGVLKGVMFGGVTFGVFYGMNGLLARLRAPGFFAQTVIDAGAQAQATTD